MKTFYVEIPADSRRGVDILFAGCVSPRRAIEIRAKTQRAAEAAFRRNNPHFFAVGIGSYERQS